MRRAGEDRHGLRARALIVVLWRSALRIQEALALNETDLDQRRWSVSSHQITLSGTLTPAIANSLVAVSWTPPNAPAFTDIVQTDANGSYADTATFENTQTYATWSVSAHFDGDSTRTAAGSATCTFFPRFP